MPMLKSRPFDSEHISWFRAQLHDIGRSIDHVLDVNDLDGFAAASIKVVANDLIKSGVVRRAPGETILDKVTNGMKLSSLHAIFKNDQPTADKNLHLKAVVIGLFEGRFDSFDPERMAQGKPQPDQFLIDASHELEALDVICRAIDKPYDYLSTTEEHFHQKAHIYRDFENNEIGHFYEWQKVSDPFEAEDPQQSLSNSEPAL